MAPAAEVARRRTSSNARRSTLRWAMQLRVEGWVRRMELSRCVCWIWQHDTAAVSVSVLVPGTAVVVAVEYASSILLLPPSSLFLSPILSVHHPAQMVHSGGSHTSHIAGELFVTRLVERVQETLRKVGTQRLHGGRHEMSIEVEGSCPQ